jgi:hypothetical protein
VIERMGDTPDATRSRLLLAEIDLCTQQAYAPVYSVTDCTGR